jgi:hypothetical protein
MTHIRGLYDHSQFFNRHILTVGELAVNTVSPQGRYEARGLRYNVGGEEEEEEEETEQQH